MGIDRLKRVNQLLRREIGEALYHVMGSEDENLSRVTVTGVEASRNLRSAVVKVSILGDPTTQKRIMSSLLRHRAQLQSLINRDLTLKYTPRLNLVLDASIDKGHHVLELLSELEGDHEDETPGTEDDSEYDGD